MGGLGAKDDGAAAPDASYPDWLFGEQRGGWCWWCASAIWVARCDVVGDLGEADAVSGSQAMIWICAPGSIMVGSPSWKGMWSARVVRWGWGREKALHLSSDTACGCCDPLGALPWSPPFPTDTKSENLYLRQLTRQQRGFAV